MPWRKTMAGPAPDSRYATFRPFAVTTVFIGNAMRSLLLFSMQHEAAVHRQQLAGHEGGAIGEEIEDGADNILGLLRARDGAALDVKLVALLGHVLRGLDLGEARR